MDINMVNGESSGCIGVLYERLSYQESDIVTGKCGGGMA